MIKIRLSVFAILLIIAAILGCQNDNTVTPQPQLRLSAVSPNLVSRGAKLFSFELQGTGLSSVVSIDFGADIAIISKQVRDDQYLEVVVNVSAAAVPGARTITATGSGGTVQLPAAITIRKNPAPVIRFTITPDPGSVSIPSVFDATATSDNGSIVSYKWEFSDGGSRSGVKSKYQFSEAGNFTVRLTVTDNQGGTTSAERQIDILDNLPPTASFVVTPSAGSQSTTFTFDATSSTDADGTVKRYRWDFADGTISNRAVVKHQFSAPGKYRIELVVTDDGGAEGNDSQVFKVKEFDEQQAIRDINDVTKGFLNRFGDIENLSADQIVVGFAQQAGCPGRNHEITIIQNEQPIIESSGVQIQGDASVYNLTETKANADLTARFFGKHTDGSTYDGVHTHHFDMINDGGQWLICDFTVN